MIKDGKEEDASAPLPIAVTDFLSSSSSLSLKSSRLPMSAGLTLIRLARLCMSSSLREDRKPHVTVTNKNEVVSDSYSRNAESKMLLTSLQH